MGQRALLRPTSDFRLPRLVLREEENRDRLDRRPSPRRLSRTKVALRPLMNPRRVDDFRRP